MLTFKEIKRRLAEHPLAHIGPGLVTGAADDDPDHARREPGCFGNRRGKAAALGHVLLGRWVLTGTISAG